MSGKPESGQVLGLPYNFERPSLGRMVKSYWQPSKGMLVEKPFGIGYTLNLSNWRSWIVLATAGALLWQERQSKAKAGRREEDPVEVIVEDDE